MNREEQFKRNHALFRIFMQQVLEMPEFAERIPNEAELIFLPENDPELREANIRVADVVRAEGKQPTFVKVSYVAKTMTVMVPQMELVKSA